MFLLATLKFSYVFFWFYKMSRTQQFHFSYNLPKKKMFKITFTVIKKRSRLNRFVFFSNSFQKQINVQQISRPFSFYISLKSRESSLFLNVVNKKNNGEGTKNNIYWKIKFVYRILYFFCNLYRFF